LSNQSSNLYLSFFGFVILVTGLFLCWSSVGQQDSFGSSYSALSDASITLLIGAFVAVVGGAFLLIGLLSAMRKHGSSLYY
jgi:cytochrome b subunit of formate dehydrogenase